MSFSDPELELESEVSVKSEEFIIEGGRRTSERWVGRERELGRFKREGRREEEERGRRALQLEIKTTQSSKSRNLDRILLRSQSLPWKLSQRAE